MPELKDNNREIELPPIPFKRYFTIREVSELCCVKPHVLRYWEQEFSQLKPSKRKGNRRYYQHHDVVLIRQIRTLLYNDGFTIGGAKQHLVEKPKSVKQLNPEMQKQLLNEIKRDLAEILTLLS